MTLNVAVCAISTLMSAGGVLMDGIVFTGVVGASEFEPHPVARQRMHERLRLDTLKKRPPKTVALIANQRHGALPQ